MNDDNDFPFIPESAEIASPLSRLSGQLLDIAIIYVMYIPAAIIMGLSGAAGSVLLAVALIIGPLYVWFADGLPNGQSLGKRRLKMQVLDARHGRPCTWGQSFLRNFTLTILGPFDWLAIFFYPNQRLGDKLARTIVIRHYA